MCSSEKSVSSAVMEAARQCARTAHTSYEILGSDVQQYVTELALKDAESSVRCFKVFLETYRLKCDLPDHLVSYYRDLWLGGNFIPLAKWATASFLASMAGRNLGDGQQYKVLPPKPAFCQGTGAPLQYLFPDSPGLVRVLRTRLQEKTQDGRATRRAMTLAWSFLGLKAMFPPMWVSGVAQSLQDHADLLSADPPPLDPRVRESIQVVGETISRFVSQRYGVRKIPYDTLSMAQLPRPKLSSSAGWVKLYDKDTERFTTMRGTRAAQHQRLSGRMGAASEELFSMDYTPHAGVVEFRQHPYQFDWKEWDFDPLVSIVALQEPFKVRTISIADGPCTAAASPLQRAWHSVLRDLPPFRLVGGERVATSVLGWLDGDGRPLFAFDGRGFVSGDYSAATDRLSMTASQLMLEVLLSKVAIDPELRRRIVVALTGSLMDYSRTLETFRGRVPDALLEEIRQRLPPLTQQHNGQLMGNILSFPILCLVNLAGYVATFAQSKGRTGDHVRAALERGYFHDWELRELPVIINGDDILFQAEPDEYERWLEFITSLGFKPSVGKNYYSPDFFTVNSELYTAQGYVSRPWWGGFETDAVRLRNELRYETGMDVLTADMRRVLPKMQEFLRATCDESNWSIVNRLWLKHHHSCGLLEPYSGLNWFLPVELGGLGLDPTGWGPYDVTYAQRKLAIRMGLDPDPSSRFFPGARGSLVTAESQRKVRELVRAKSVTGELVYHNGHSYVLDRHQPMALRLRGRKMVVHYRVHPTMDTFVQKSNHFDSWMDYHTQGIRLDREKVVAGVRAALHWGLRLSDKHLPLFQDLQALPRYRCAFFTELLPASELQIP